MSPSHTLAKTGHAAKPDTSTKTDLVIVGAGIVGAACAWQAAEAGLSVTILEGQFPASGATAAGMGHLVVMDDSPAQIALTHLSCQLWREVRAELPAIVEYDPCGTLWVAADAEEMAEVDRKHAFYQGLGIDAQIVGSEKLYQIEPHMRPGLAGGLRVVGDAVIYPPCATDWMLEKARAKGAVLRRHFPVHAIEEGTVRLADGSQITGQTVVVAAGIGSIGLISGIEVRPRKGHLVITDRYPGWLRHQVVELGYLKSAHKSSRDSVAFNVQPRKTGQILIGSSRQYDATDPVVDPAILKRMMARALEYMPGLADLSCLRVWTGFRASTPDKVPLIGPVAGQERLWLATGHEGLGITTSLGTARLLVDRLLGKTPTIPWEPFDPGRFAKTDAKEPAHA